VISLTRRVLGGLAALALASALVSVPSASTTVHAAPSFRYIPGYSVQSGWLCYDWVSANGYQTLHCTQNWHRGPNGQLISDSPSWVPNVISPAPKPAKPASGPAASAHASAGGYIVRNGDTLSGIAVAHHTTLLALERANPQIHNPNLILVNERIALPGEASQNAAPVSAPAVSRAPTGISQWAYTGHAAWRMWDVAAIGGNKSALSYPFGQCTWYAAYAAVDNVSFLGDARYWTASARVRGLRISLTPVAGSTAVFQPGVQGASWLGHVAHVVAVYPNGWFLVSEMNFYWNGGGFGVVSYRYAHAGAGVAFIL